MWGAVAAVAGGAILGAMSGGDKAPEPPDLSRYINDLGGVRDKLSALADMELSLAASTMNNVDAATADFAAMIRPHLERNLQMMETEYDRYMEKYVPVQDKALQTALNYDTPERRQREADRAKAEIETEISAQRASAEQRLSSYGIQPDERGRLDKELAIASAEAKAASSMQARDNVEKTGMSLIDQQARFGEQVRQNADAYSARSVQYGDAIRSAEVNAEQFKRGAYNGAMNAYNGMANISGQQASIASGAYEHQFAANQYNQENSVMASAMQGAGLGLGMYSAGGGFAAEGGVIPEGSSNQPPPPQSPTDTVNMNLAEGEFVIPSDVVKFKGEEFFYKLMEKSKQNKAEMEGGGKQPAPAIPTGMPAPAPQQQMGVPA